MASRQTLIVNAVLVAVSLELLLSSCEALRVKPSKHSSSSKTVEDVETALAIGILQLLEKHQDDKALEILRTMINFNTIHRAKLCTNRHSPSPICAKTNAELSNSIMSFYTGAQAALRSMDKDEWEQYKPILVADFKNSLN